MKTALPMLSVSLFFAGSLFTVFGKNTRLSEHERGYDGIGSPRNTAAFQHANSANVVG